jgi:ribosomal subunit interface protein
MILNIKATGVELTDKLRRHVEEKMKAVERYFDNIQKIELDIGMRSKHHQSGKIFYADVNVHIPGKVVRVSKDTEDVFKAIDKVKDHLKVEFEKIKGKMRHKDKKMLREQKSYREE